MAKSAEGGRLGERGSRVIDAAPSGRAVIGKFFADDLLAGTFKTMSGAASAVEGVQLRAFLAGQLEVEDPAAGRDPVPVG